MFGFGQRLECDQWTLDDFPPLEFIRTPDGDIAMQHYCNERPRALGRDFLYLHHTGWGVITYPFPPFLIAGATADHPGEVIPTLKAANAVFMTVEDAAASPHARGRHAG